jgi:glycosyltransferase involved in cell wall biosynthesis
VTTEAFASGRAVLTCTDSGGPTELVRDGETGLVSAPTPVDLATALARVMDDQGLAERLGRGAAAQVAAMTWPDAVKRLVIV